MSTTAAGSTSGVATQKIDGIPVRNLWLLMLYASQLFRQVPRAEVVGVEDNPEDIPDLVAEMLTRAVEHRLSRNLTHGYRSEHAILNRVRGHIDVLETTTRRLLSRGAIACRFESLTIDTPRNQFVRAALETLAGVVRRPELAHRCRALSLRLERLGVAQRRPSRAEISMERYGRHDAADRFMVAAASLAFDLALPTEAAGNKAIRALSRDSHWIRNLYEKAVGGFYDVVLSPRGWQVSMGRIFRWPVDERTARIDGILPIMKTDIVLDHPASNHRIVIDTKFTAILVASHFREAVLRSGYLYQLYAYLRSQEIAGDPLCNHASGLLLHPSVGEMIDETAVIQGHAMRFATVDLAASASEIRSQLLHVVDVQPSDT